jgi:DNA-binding MarR family transcriptional regulator
VPKDKVSIKQDELDRLEAALTSYIRTFKRSDYWETVLNRADVQLDRPASAIVGTLDASDQCQFQQLVSRLGIEAPSVSRKVHMLESAGLVERVPTADRRVHELRLSSRGKSLAKKLTQAKHQLLSEIVSDWTSSDIEQLVILLERFAADMTARFNIAPDSSITAGKTNFKQDLVNE